MEQAAVEFRHISMQFPGVLANDNVSLNIEKGKVFALVGENGAGKTTLMKIVYGMYRPTDGEVYIMGKRVKRFDSSEAIRHGIGMVHQHFMLVPSFTVAQNIVLSREPKKFGIFFDEKRAIEITKRMANEYGFSIDPYAKINDISVGAQQRVEILKAMYRGADTLILDEPTAVLTPGETAELFNIIRRIVEEKGITVIIITHKLYEVMEIADRVGVMRAGKLVYESNIKDVTMDKLAAVMVGHEVIMSNIPHDTIAGDIQLSIKDLTVSSNMGLIAVNGLNLNIRAGEIVGIAGVEGNGQSELIEAITGLRKPNSGSIIINGTEVALKSPGEIRKLGVAHVPEDRMATGTSPKGTIAENLIAGKQRDKEYQSYKIHQRRSSIERYAADVFKNFDIRAAGIGTQVGSLSGGNIQKTVVAREFSFENANVLIISQPTRGVDIGAMNYIHDLIADKRRQGCAILLVSADLDELFRLSDRIAVIYNGEITGMFNTEDTTKAEIGMYMTGAKRRSV